MKKGQTMKKRVLKLMVELSPKSKTAKEIHDIASTRWTWAPTVNQIAQICRTTKTIVQDGFVNVTSSKSRYRGILWVHLDEDFPDSGE